MTGMDDCRALLAEWLDGGHTDDLRARTERFLDATDPGAAPAGYEAALAWFRADPERMRDLDDVDNRSAAIAIVRAALAGDAFGPAGRDLTAQDVDDALHIDCPTNEQIADFLNGIARPSEGAGQPDTAEPRIPTAAEIVDEYEASQRASTDLKTFPQVGDRARITTGASVGVVGTVNHFVAPVSWHLVEDDGAPIGWYSADELELPDRSPRSWSLPAPPPDDVTVVHVDGVRFDRYLNMWRDSANGKTLLWGELLDSGTVVEGEPPAPEPQEPPTFSRGFYRLARDLDLGRPVKETVPAETQVAVIRVGGEDCSLWYPGGSGSTWSVPLAALAAAGAEREGDR